ncbi:UDP-N-acetylmuramate--alanine ligase [Parabacteroides sp. PFB2-12]|uniref:UDP-N-acetylmuramate--L-alanine ligase n=1 Tax=unclassified Parabacteroides TaxID=2649774 RepID=UPI0024748F7E|nr:MULTISPECIES: UDP-N-acetylmuramate--L-alanine ligase [unclassified Parabacteroides]MDH6342178.1 UDP-N-acetylmuramate--alanine ligase [Parabacteroides sp. PM6-13]MDH6391138.1 UDP-N-acetylmuramate--alanine ligase [Parabacteroides sp. PFB2-12]
MHLNDIQSLYFVGAGGIGMSALVRYFLSKGKKVAGYDRVSSVLTEKLNAEGADIHYEDNVALIPAWCKNPADTLVVYTPAVPNDHTELVWFREHGFTVMKRAQILGEITRSARGLCVAGTHGKTTTSSMTAHVLKQSHVDCNAFLGGILKNWGSNLMLSDKSDLTVIEADEYDRSFHQLTPYMAVITSADPDHLDIYGDAQSYRDSFEHFTSLIRPEGCLIMRKDIAVTPRLQPGVRLFTYSAEEGGDFYAENIRIGNGDIFFDFIGPDVAVRDVSLGVPVQVNIENAVAAMAVAWLNGVTEEELTRGIASFAGPERRFDFQLKEEDIVLIDDYAHHPMELEASIRSVKALYPDRKVTGIFQPHLYSRTRDFVDGFAESLSLLDELILLDIYPARELPIPGVTSQLILDKVTLSDKRLCRKEDLLDWVEGHAFDIVLMLGAGDIDRLVKPVKEILEKKRDKM